MIRRYIDGKPLSLRPKCRLCNKVLCENTFATGWNPYDEGLCETCEELLTIAEIQLLDPDEWSSMLADADDEFYYLTRRELEKIGKKAIRTYAKLDVL